MKGELFASSSFVTRITTSSSSAANIARAHCIVAWTCGWLAKASKDPEYQVKQAQVEHLYAIADGEFGPLDLMPGRAVGPPILPGTSDHQALPHFALDGPDHAHDARLRQIVGRANVS